MQLKEYYKLSLSFYGDKLYRNVQESSSFKKRTMK